MPIPNFSSIKRIARPRSVYEFDDPEQTELWSMSLRRPDDAELGVACDLEVEYTKKYIEGGWINGKGKFEEEPAEFLDILGEPSPLSKDNLFYATKLYVAQDVDDPNDALTLDQILGMIPYYQTGWQKAKLVVLDFLSLPKAKKGDTITS